MKIKKISCEQFAGIRDVDVTFGDGLNVVYGKNESGKSTLVNLLSRTLFQKADLDRRSDREFIDLYFPAVPKGGIKLNAIDGKITFETEKGTYTLKKEWGEDTRCSLSAPEGVIRDQARIDEILREVLRYGEGVYSGMLFSSQRNIDISLQAVLGSSEKTDLKQEIAAAVTKSFAESDGLSVDEIERAIREKIDKIAGSHWDIARNIPSRKSGGGRWEKGLGEIHKSYYVLEDAKAVLDKITELENAADRASDDYKIKNAEAEKAEKAYRNLDKYASRLIVRSALKDKLNGLKNDIEKYTEAVTRWPIYAGQLQKAQSLLSEKTGRELLDKYSAAKQISDRLDGFKAFQKNRSCPSEKEIAAVKSAQRDAESLENKLCGMNISANIRMFGGNRIEIKSLRTGRTIDASVGVIPLTEAVDITVPGVMEMQLTPADAEVLSIQSRIKKQREIISAIFVKYGVERIEELEDISRQFADNEREIKTAEFQLAASLGGNSLEELEKSAAELGEIRRKQDIEDEISALCGGVDLSRFIAGRETLLEGYVKDYGDIVALREKLRRAKEDYTATEKSVTEEEIPSEYLNVTDPEKYRKILQTDLELKNKDRERALTEKTRSSAALDNFEEAQKGDPVADAALAERYFNEQKILLSHWLHIYEVFKRQKESLNSNPMHDISQSFTRYLRIISDGKVSSEFPEQNRLDMNIYSDNRPVDYGKLSEGTKDTVFLAFRLAVLDHLFPEGGGVIVLDDPFTDMDGERTLTACKLVKECATRHQVIFLTCKEEYLKLLGGNAVKIG